MVHKGRTLGLSLTMNFDPALEIPGELAEAVGRWYVFNHRHELLLVDGMVPEQTAWSESIVDQHLLGVESPTDHSEANAGRQRKPIWAARGSEQLSLGPGSQFVSLRESFTILDESDWIMAGRASQILAWAADHAFCGRCGRPTAPMAQERALKCADCNLMAFPRLTPAVIMLVERDDGKALLAWGRQFPGRFYSALAGFVEPGESLEQTVVREVREEVGIEVDDIRYFGSQPWPFPNSVMIGFNANYVGGDLKIQESEIVEAGWYDSTDLPPVPRGRMSIAGWLIEDWIQRQSN